jgi:hypothetical protein
MPASFVDTLVRAASGDYVTSTVGGKRASCAMSAQCAAQRLGEKLYGTELLRVELLKQVDTSVGHWRIHYRTRSAR